MTESHSNSPLGKLLRDLRMQSQRHKEDRRIALLLFVWAVIFLAVNLSACATKSVPLAEEQQKTPLPAITQPIPSEPYSLSAATLFKKWQEMLTGTSTISLPAAQ